MIHPLQPHRASRPLNRHRGVAALAAALCALLAAAAHARNVTFISASDPHYREPDHKHGNHNDLNRATVAEINRIAGTAWPEKCRGGTIDQPRATLLLGAKKDVKFSKDPDGRNVHEWGGEWGRSWFVDKPL